MNFDEQFWILYEKACILDREASVLDKIDWEFKGEGLEYGYGGLML